jgi:hypothetical protein
MMHHMALHDTWNAVKRSYHHQRSYHHHVTINAIDPAPHRSGRKSGVAIGMPTQQGMQMFSTQQGPAKLLRNTTTQCRNHVHLQTVCSRKRKQEYILS